MITEIITQENEHFEYRLNEKGEAYKYKLSDKIISKQVKVTYDENNNEVSRELYVPNEGIALKALLSATPEEIAEIKKLLLG